MKTLLRVALAIACAIALTCGPFVAPIGAQSDSFPDKTVISSCTHWVAITPADGVPLARLPKALWIGTAGNINMVGNDAPVGAAGITWPNVPAGMLSVRPRVINASLTTASGIIACL